MAKLITKLYAGEVDMVFDPYWHTYVVTDSKADNLPSKKTSVTTALKIIDKPQIRRWAVNMTVEYMKERLEPGKSYDEIQLASMLAGAKNANTQRMTDAGDSGTLLHQWVEDFINHKNPKIPVNPMLKESVKKFLTWVKKNKIEFLLPEQPIYSRKFGYAGTLDFICRYNGELYIGDLKTSSGIYLEQMLQTTPYRAAREEEFPEEKYAGQLICRIGKDGSFEFKLLDDKSHPKMYQRMFMCFVAFLKGSELYHQLEAETK